MVVNLSFEDMDFFVLANVIEEMDDSARLLRRATILLGLAPLGIKKRLPLRLSTFSSIICLNELGSFCFSQRHIILDSCNFNSSSNLRIRCSFCLSIVCCLNLPIFLQDF